MIVCQKWVSLTPEAISQQLDAWREQWPALGVLALLPEAEKAALPVLQSACRERSVTLAGAVFPALIVDDRFVSTGVWLIGFERMPNHFLIPDLGSAAVDKLAQAIKAGRPEGQPTLFLVFDSMQPNVASILHRLHQAIGNCVGYTGVNAGSETFQPMPCLFDATQLVGQGALGLFLPEVSRVAVKHAYPVSKTLMRSTSAQGNRIDRIDNRPAFEVYRDVIAAEYGIALTHENFYDYAVHFPFGLVTAVDVLVRIPVAFNADGSLFCVGEVPPNSMLRLLKAAEAGDEACVTGLAQSLGLPQAGGEPMPLLTFYCAGRRMHLGEAAEREIAHLKALTAAPLVYGALSLGEIDQLEDLSIPRFHNAALVCLSQA